MGFTYLGHDRWVAHCDYPDCDWVMELWVMDGDLGGAMGRGVFAGVGIHGGTHGVESGGGNPPGGGE